MRWLLLNSLGLVRGYDIPILSPALETRHLELRQVYFNAGEMKNDDAGNL